MIINYYLFIKFELDTVCDTTKMALFEYVQISDIVICCEACNRISRKPWMLTRVHSLVDFA